jgi:diadenosine tetraphosphate (Ap4A) HIT family hydrolase
MSEDKKCRFCDRPDAVIENELAFTLYDSSPVNPGHCLILTRRHVADYFETTDEERVALWALPDEMKPIIDQEHAPDGYNVGVNIGETAGQSIPHVHIHMIPRYKGDIANPRGGVRGVIPHKQKYETRPPGAPPSPLDMIPTDEEEDARAAADREDEKS